MNWRNRLRDLGTPQPRQKLHSPEVCSLLLRLFDETPFRCWKDVLLEFSGPLELVWEATVNIKRPYMVYHHISPRFEPGDVAETWIARR